MKTYENNSIKWWTNVWKDVKPFDVLTNQEVYQKYIDVVDSIDDFAIRLNWKLKKRISKWNNKKDGSSVDIVKRQMNAKPGGKMIYLEIPYQFYEDYMTGWLDNNSKNQKVVSLDELKGHIKNNTKWTLNGLNDGRSYHNYYTFKEFGVANPVYNNGVEYPKRSTHITAYCFLNKSDVPILFMLPEHSTKIFSTIPNKEELPYFKDKYLTLDIDIKNKLVNFFLEDEHIGVYKG